MLHNDDELRVRREWTGGYGVHLYYESSEAEQIFWTFKATTSCASLNRCAAQLAILKFPSLLNFQHNEMVSEALLLQQEKKSHSSTSKKFYIHRVLKWSEMSPFE